MDFGHRATFDVAIRYSSLVHRAAKYEINGTIKKYILHLYVYCVLCVSVRGKIINFMQKHKMPTIPLLFATISISSRTNYVCVDFSMKNHNHFAFCKHCACNLYLFFSILWHLFFWFSLFHFMYFIEVAVDLCECPEIAQHKKRIECTRKEATSNFSWQR